MTIVRAAIADYLHEQFSALAAAVGQAEADASFDGYGADVNNALRRLGKTESELPTATAEDGQRERVFALAEYYAARRFWRLLSDRANVKVDDSSFDYRHVVTNAKALMDEASQVCAALGDNVSAGGWGVGYLNLDWLEPETAE